MNKSTLCKLSIACAICCAVICGVSIAPLVAAGILAVVALLCYLACAVLFLVGFFVLLFSAFQASIWPLASSVGEFGTGLFGFVSPIANFSFNYITPIAGWVALGVGIVGIIVSSIGISKANKQIPQQEAPSEPIAAPANPTDTVAYGTANNGKKVKKKKQKTEKGVYIATLVVSIVFSVVAIIAVIVAAKMTGKI